MITHPLPKDVLDKLFTLRRIEADEQRRLRIGKSLYQHKREHKTLDNWIEKNDTNT